jgi:uncharacterized protein YgbK (DUF1537 family)
VRKVVAIADDLSGAAETAAALAQLSPQAAEKAGDVLVTLGMPDVLPDTHVLVVDLASRASDPAIVEATLLAAIRAIPRSTLTFKKVDSQLRGNTGIELRALARQRHVLFAPALPSIGRTTVGGRVWLSGNGGVEVGAVSRDVASLSVTDLFDDISTTVVGLEAIRGPRSKLLDTISLAFERARVVILDAETDDDLTAIATAALRLPDVLLAGSGGLAAALGRLDDSDGKRDPVFLSEHRNILVVVGTSEPTAAAQIEQLRLTGADIHVLDTGERIALREVKSEREVTVIGISWPSISAAPDPSAMDALSMLLTDAAQHRDLVLTGGETARTVLELVSEARLHPLAEIRTGAVVSRTPTGRIVATRPGSFGDENSLVELVTAIRALRETRSPVHPTSSGKVDA